MYLSIHKRKLKDASPSSSIRHQAAIAGRRPPDGISKCCGSNTRATWIRYASADQAPTVSCVTEILLLPASRDRYRDGHVLITASPPTDSAFCVEIFFWQAKQYVSNGCHCQVRSSAVDVDDDSVSATTGHRCLRSSWWL